MEHRRGEQPSVFFYKVKVLDAPPDDGLITVFACELGRDPEALKTLMTEAGEVAIPARLTLRWCIAWL